MDFTESCGWWERSRNSRIEWTYEGREKGRGASAKTREDKHAEWLSNT